ncbi:MAG: hypothetical protein AAGG38_03230 [Planctomycetota bacterium]
MNKKELVLRRHYRSLVKRVVLLFLLLWAVLWFNGCNIIAYGAQAFRTDQNPVDVAAEYTDLEGKRVAVLVAADEYTLFRFPRSPFRTGEAVSRGIVENLPEVSVSLPKEIARYQRSNPYWITTRPSRIIDELGVDRLVIIDLNEYRTNEAGNINVWKGVIDGTVSVYEADGEDPDNRTFERQVRAEFPRDSEFGLVRDRADEESVEAAVLEAFALKAGGLFYDHQEDRP